MSKISSMMNTGRGALMNSQTALQTVGHNIANKTTEGFSRQRVEVLSNGAQGMGNLRVGTGARAALVTRVNNPYLEKQIEKEGSAKGFMGSKADALLRVEQVYNEQMNKGLNQYMTDFFNAFRELANNPESLTSRTMVQEASHALAKDFNRVDKQLESVQEDLDWQVKSEVEAINKMTREIAQLNEKVQVIEVQGIPANDERDRRELLIKQLAEKIDVSYAEGSNGLVTVTAGRNGVLVSGFGSTELKAAKTSDRNRMEIFVSPTGEVNANSKITDFVSGGSLGGALEVRDRVIEDMRTNVDGLATAFANEVNKAHAEGFDQNGAPGAEFFKLPNAGRGAAANISVNQVILNDASKISAASKPNAPAENTVANVISSLQYRQVMDGGVATFDDYYNSQVGKVGVLAQRAVKSREAQEQVLQQLSNIRESISGVSLDEETTKMIEFQKAYDASARLIRTADEMLDTVMNIKR